MKKTKIKLDDMERRILVKLLYEKLNELIREGRYTDAIIGLHEAIAEEVVQAQDLDVVVLKLLDPALHQVTAKEVIVLCPRGGHHGANQSVEVGNIVTDVGGVLNGNEVCAACNLLKNILMGGELAVGVALNIDGAIGLLTDVVSCFLHGNCQLLGGAKNVDPHRRLAMRTSILQSNMLVQLINHFLRTEQFCWEINEQLVKMHKTEKCAPM